MSKIVDWPAYVIGVIVAVLTGALQLAPDLGLTDQWKAVLQVIIIGLGAAEVTRRVTPVVPEDRGFTSAAITNPAVGPVAALDVAPAVAPSPAVVYDHSVEPAPVEVPVAVEPVSAEAVAAPAAAVIPTAEHAPEAPVQQPLAWGSSMPVPDTIVWDPPLN